MKKLILAALSVGLSASLYAQGTVTFQNATLGGHVTLYSLNGPIVPAGFTVALYWAPGTTGVAESSLVPIATFTSTTAGIFYDGATVTTPAATPGGAQATFEVRGWTGGYATYDAAFAAAMANPGVVHVGITPMFVNGTGNPAPPATAAANLTGWNGNLVLDPMPEPSTIALAGLGAASLLLFRRKRD